MNTTNAVNNSESKSTQNKNNNLLDDEKKAMEYVSGIKEFYGHLLSFIVTISILTVINLFVSPEYLWVLWCVFGWGIGIVTHAIQAFEVFSLFSPQWEKKQIEKRLGRDL
jgi:hypothetical protein